MIKFLIHRVVFGLITIILVSIVINTIIFYAPVDPARMSFGQRSDEETIQLFKKKYFLDKSLSVQLFHFFEDLSPIQILNHNDVRKSDYRFFSLLSFKTHDLIIKKPYFRKSYSSGKSVWEMVMNSLPETLLLALLSMLVGITIGLALGFFASLNVNTYWDRMILAFCSITYSIPSYVSSLLVVILFASWLGNYTGLPIQGSLWEFNDEGELELQLRNLILPVLALGIRPVSMIAQMTRVACLDVLQSDYIRTARAKGINSLQLIKRHLLPNCINPILTTISSWFASLLAGSFFVEYVFNYKGLGLLTISALNQFDVPLISACCIVVVSFFVIVNTITDILYTYFDPRIKLN